MLTTRKVDGDPTSEKSEVPYRCTAARLLELLGVRGSLPPVVVVNACHTADPDYDPAVRLEQSSSDLAFAAQLVQGGVPMALGMSGEVAARACQIFTLRFYMALLAGGSVALATAHGRRAALLGSPRMWIASTGLALPCSWLEVFRPS